MVAAIIQARMGSNRFPGKTMKKILGKPMLWYIWNRVKAVKALDDIIIVAPDLEEDNVIRDFASEMGIKFFSGPSNDVLNLFYQAANLYNLKAIVRITADDPFKDPKIIDYGLLLYQKSDVDYIANCSYDGSIKPTYPEGLDIEIFSFSCLEKIWKNAKKDSEREHVTPYLFNNSSHFKMKGFYNSEDLSALRWTVDYERDFVFATEIYKRLYPKKRIFLMNDILRLLEKEPHLKKINTGTLRHEGYQQSLMKENL